MGASTQTCIFDIHSFDMNSVETWLYLLLPMSLSCVVVEDGNFQNSGCRNLSVILTSVLEKQNLCLWYLESVGLCYCKWMHVAVAFKVHLNCLKTIKIQMSYLFIYTLQQEMKLQTWRSSGSGILPGSWGTGQSVPVCRGMTCHGKVKDGQEKRRESSLEESPVWYYPVRAVRGLDQEQCWDGRRLQEWREFLWKMLLLP